MAVDEEEDLLLQGGFPAHDSISWWPHTDNGEAGGDDERVAAAAASSPASVKDAVIV